MVPIQRAQASAELELLRKPPRFEFRHRLLARRAVAAIVD
jgi:hypothetical protein